MADKSNGDISQDLKSSALFYHRNPRPGKLEIQATKPLGNQRDLALAYSPGVAAPCEAIAADPSEAANLTSRQNLAAVINALELAGKRIEEVKIVTSGAGAAALACLNLLVSLGAKRENIFVTDIEGVVYEGRDKLMDRWKAVYAQPTEARTLADVIPDADVFLGLSAGGILKPELLGLMAPRPLIMGLANPY